MFGFVKKRSWRFLVAAFRSGSMSARSRAITIPARLCLENLESRTLLSGLTPMEIRHAYDFDQVRFLDGMVPGDGSGQTIAIVDAFHDPNIFSDVDVFDATFSSNGNQSLFDQYGSSQSFLTLAMPDGRPPTDPGWSLEISLDVEWAHAIAPGAKILLVEAATTSYNAIIDAVDYARHQIGVVAVSMSWGSEEFQPESIFDSYFTTPYGHLGGSNGFGGFNLPGGVTFVAASGDYGSPPEWPAVSPNVLAVGGTSLNLDASGNYQFETPWLFSGGGVSFYEPRPSYQTGTPSSNMRTNPDVGFDADPKSGFAVYDSVGISGLDGWMRVGGTSAGAPQWAALIAIADQGRALMGNGSLDGMTQTLPAIYSLPDSVFHTPQGGSPLVPGSTYSLEVGRGTPIANLLIPALPGLSPPPPPVAGRPSAPGSPAPGVDAPVSPPKKTNPPSKTDHGQNLAAILIIQTGDATPPWMTTNPAGQRSSSPVDLISLSNIIPLHLLDGPVITGIGSVPEIWFAPEGKPHDLGGKDDAFADEKAMPDSISEDTAMDRAPADGSNSTRETADWNIEPLISSIRSRQPPIPHSQSPAAIWTDGQPTSRGFMRAINRNWEWDALFVGVAALLGPFLAEPKPPKADKKQRK